MKKAKKTNKSEFSNKKISTVSGNTAVTNPEELLDFAVAVAVRLQSCGAETYRVEETVVRIIEAYGIDKSDVFVIPGSIFAGLEDENGQVYSKIRRVKNIDTILDGVELYSAFCRRIVRRGSFCVKPKKAYANTNCRSRISATFSLRRVLLCFSAERCVTLSVPGSAALRSGFVFRAWVFCTPTRSSKPSSAGLCLHLPHIPSPYWVFATMRMLFQSEQ